jgi:hypothetical protein
MSCTTKTTDGIGYSEYDTKMYVKFNVLLNIYISLRSPINKNIFEIIILLYINSIQFYFWLFYMQIFTNRTSHKHIIVSHFPLNQNILPRDLNFEQ